MFLLFFFFLTFWLESSPIHEAILKRQCFITKLGKCCPFSILCFWYAFFSSPSSPLLRKHGKRKPITFFSLSLAGSPSCREWARLVAAPCSPAGSLCLGGGGGGGGGGPAGGGHCEERVLDGLRGGGGGVKAGYRSRVPCGGCGGRDQAHGVAGEQREVLRVQEQGGSHDVGGSACIGKDQVPSGIQ